jgi:hypothetical protein
MPTDERHYHPLASAVGGSKQVQASPLTALPPELRNRIYALVFENHVSDAAKGPTIHYEGSLTNDKRIAASTPGLILTCKQLHQEALGIFYTHAKFQFFCLEQLEMWQWRIGKPRTVLMRHVRIMNLASGREWSVKYEKEAIAEWSRQGKFNSELEVWLRIGPHSSKFGGRIFILWTRNPDVDAKSWREWQESRSSERFMKDLKGRIAAGDFVKDFDYPMWLIDIESKCYPEPRWKLNVLWSDS